MSVVSKSGNHRVKILPLAKNPGIYSCNAYMVLGDWNRIEDVNTLIDIGSDGYVLFEIAGLSTGVGKSRVEKVIFTHSHFDHAAGMKAVSKAFQPEMLAYNKFPGITKTLIHGQLVKCGDEYFEVIHVPGHSNDSICLYCPTGGVLFSGDTPLQIKSPGGSYTPEFLAALENLAARPVEVIYPGHGDIIRTNASGVIRSTLETVKKTMG